ncbi:hypothetical protein QBC46DRAFT_372897 [Diplogelasinospora grovesii]|uniref:Mitochondrial seryl-tRNA synthetase n=1 Tax=Diplogelasinospora grovesii TaxID=303347 RepID=A0AAN6NK97_9PEZI|nr:hypothetical protein QBC46DRAFT_372897 [Diplogelasinospora grovesii]
MRLLQSLLRVRVRVRTSISIPRWTLQFRMPRAIIKRHYSTAKDDDKTLSRAERIFSRLPTWTRRYTSRLRDAPVSHVVAFLILHEITAVVPLFALAGFFHYYTDVTNNAVVRYTMDNYGGYVREGVGRFERYFKRKGWFGFQPDHNNNANEQPPNQAGQTPQNGGDEVLQHWTSDRKVDGKYKVVLEVALAYALTKAFLPVRIVGSVWATPWFASVLVRLRHIVKR